MNARNAAILIGLVFIVVGALGFVNNPVIGTEDAIFHADKTHNLVHIISGVLFLVIAFAAPGFIRTFLRIFGVVYFLLGIIGLLSIGSSGMTEIAGFLHVNGADNYLHIGLGILIFLAGSLPVSRNIR